MNTSQTVIGDELHVTVEDRGVQFSFDLPADSKLSTIRQAINKAKERVKAGKQERDDREAFNSREKVWRMIREAKTFGSGRITI